MLSQNGGMAEQSPKAFISYSWSSPQHQLRVKSWADRLIADGIDVTLDIYDLKEGHDKFAFMERMVTDETVSHVLVICDKSYSSKADARKAGVGTESQIISKEVYEKVAQSKFIPIACEFETDGSPFLPIFLKSRIWIDFSSDEAVSENWEQLIRVLYGKPLHVKPKLGSAPAFLSDDSSAPVSPAATKYAALKQAILHSKPALRSFRSEFIDACVEFIDSLRIRKQPNIPKLGEQILADCGKLRPIRNLIVDWVLFESSANSTSEFCDSLIGLLERLREMKARPEEINSWNDEWFGAHSLFVYETFLYMIAALIKVGRDDVLHDVFTTHYLLPKREWHGDQRFDTFDCFYGSSGALGSAINPEGQRYNSPGAELIKRQSDRSDLPFSALIEAELLVFMMALITPNARWYPGTLHYANYSVSFPLFIRGAQRKGFKRFATITGVDDAERLRTLVKEGHQRMGAGRWSEFRSGTGYWETMNLDQFDSLK